MKKRIMVLIIAALLVSGCNKGQEELQAADDLLEVIQNQNDIIDGLRQQIDMLQDEIAIRDDIIKENNQQEEKSQQDIQLEEFLKWQEEHFKRVRENLMSRPDLIPFEGVHGGMPGFYYEDKIYIDFDYVFAYAEDGHFATYMVLKYHEEDNTIFWELVAYDLFDGLGFRLV
ncbi:MAG: hypothetical protein FWE74_06695 [Oscillospiraceae bacterium]|nr:hypothetical protein [Oscillospiraceae bacterium]